MSTRPARRRSPVVVKQEPRPDRRRRSKRPEILDPHALEAPMPGPLLVLLSQLHRAEAKPDGGSDPA